MVIDNPVLFHIGKSAWTLGGTCVATGIMMAVLWGCSIPFVAKRLNVKPRRLSADEAATLAMTGHESDYVKPEAAIHGPAAGVEWRYSWDIGDLRAAWQTRRYGYFFGLPLHGFCFVLALLLVFGGATICGDNPVRNLVLVALPFALFAGLLLFTMWAAVFTKLE